MNNINFFEVAVHDIQELDEYQLPDLLRRLLILESQQYKFKVAELHVPNESAIHTPDGGEDGQIELTTDPPPESELKKKLTVFQCKATDLSPSECGKEILSKDGSSLKPRIQKCLETGGDYILFTTQSLVQLQIDDRIDSFCQAIAQTGKSFTDPCIRIFDANKIQNWTNQHVAAVTAVLSWRGRSILTGFRTWEDWSGEQDFQDVRFVADATVQSLMTDLRAKLGGDKQVVRLLGLSGLGKTRLALESLRPPSGAGATADQNISQNVAYVDAQGGNSNLANRILGLRQVKQSGLLVVDNCPLDLHEQLKNFVQHTDSRLRLLTLYNDPDERPSNTPLIVDRMTDEQIREIIQPYCTGLPSSDLDRVVRFAQGFPQMAVLMVRSRREGGSTLDRIVDDHLLEKLLGSKLSEGSEPRKVLEACALFTMVGFENERKEEYQYVASHICKIEHDDFFGHVKTLLARKLVQKNGRLIRVEPMPLAVRLAANWWQRCSPDLAKKIIREMPDALSEALCARMAILDFLPEAQELVEDLCGCQGPFGQAEVLSSERGSRLFRYLAEVNPKAALDALERAFSGCSREQLLSVTSGRRNLIWTLEKLVFSKEWFLRSARLLLAFASAENESWGNNASGIFQRLFHVYLSGTEAPPEERLLIIDEALASPEPARQGLAVEALQQSIETLHFMRFGGAEQMGSGPARRDWQPESRQVVTEYWQSALERLTRAACADGELAAKARAIIAQRIRGLAPVLPDALDATMQQVVARHGPVWPEAVESLLDAKRFDRKSWPPAVQERVDTWERLLKPPAEEIAGRLHLLVSRPPWEHVKGRTGHSELVALADELANSIDWNEHLPNLLQGEQRQSVAFGRRLGEVMFHPEPFCTQALQVLTTLPIRAVNATLLAAFLAGIRPRFPLLVTKILEDVSSREALHPHLVSLTCLCQPTWADLERVLTLIRAGRIPSSQAKNFAYGGVLGHLPPADVMQFCDALSGCDADGAWAGLDILIMFSHGDTTRHDAVFAGLRRLLMHPNLKMLTDALPMDIHHWGMVAEKLLENRDEELACHLCNTILATCHHSIQIQDYHHAAIPVLRSLLKHYRAEVWPLVGEELLNAAPVPNHDLESLLGNRFGQEQDEPGALFVLPDECLLNWCQEHPEEVPARLARIMPLLQQEGERWTWRPLARAILDQYGHQKKVRAAIDVNLGTFSWSGSIIPFYERQRYILKELENHGCPEVKSWVDAHLRYLGNQIRMEDRNDQESSWER